MDQPPRPIPAMDDAEAQAAPASAAGDLTQGYRVCVYVLPDGSYRVSGPESMDDDDETEATGEAFDNIGAALKGVMEVIKQNPVTDDAGAQMEAGYAEG